MRQGAAHIHGSAGRRIAVSVTTCCLTCVVSTGVGEMMGIVGLPTLDERPREGEAHALAVELGGELYAESDQETFGFIDFGFRAIGLHLHAHDVYRAFLASHAGHRIYLADEGTQWDRLLPHLETRDEKGINHDPTEFIEYEQPSKNEGYIKARLVFECSRCEDAIEGEEPNWVKPFEPKTLAASDVTVFCKHVANENAEMCFHEAEPFGFLYADVADFLRGHKAHGVVMRLEEDS